MITDKELEDLQALYDAGESQTVHQIPRLIVEVRRLREENTRLNRKLDFVDRTLEGRTAAHWPEPRGTGA